MATKGGKGRAREERREGGGCDGNGNKRKWEFSSEEGKNKVRN